MNFTRFSWIKDPLFAEAMALYATSFPLFEQRSNKSQIRALSDPDFFAYGIHEEEQFVGILFC